MNCSNWDDRNQRGENVARYQYDAVGRLRTQTLPNAVIATTSYNARHEVISLTQGLVNQTPLASYTYDLANRLLTETRAGVTTTYAYDNAGNRTSMVRPSGTTGYNYDARGNQTSETTLGGVTGSYTWDARDRLTQATVGANVALPRG